MSDRNFPESLCPLTEKSPLPHHGHHHHHQHHHLLFYVSHPFLTDFFPLKEDTLLAKQNK